MKDIKSINNQALKEMYEQGKREALSSGVVGEMVEFIRASHVALSITDRLVGEDEDSKYYRKTMESILSKLEADNG